VLQHQGLRVADLDRALAFYTEALGATVLARPFEMAGPGAAQALDGPADTRFRLGIVGFGGGTGIELFETGGAPPAGRLPHLALQVDDLDAALERVERGGGARLWDAPGAWGSVRVVFVRDPDGNVLELLDGPLSAVADEAVRMYPEARP
jgi:lactoylglutathione lyase